MKQFTFYDLYYIAIQHETDELAGKIITDICNFEFLDEPIDTSTDDSKDSVFCTFEDVLYSVKELEAEGKVPKNYNLKMKHFLFSDTIWRTMKPLTEAERGSLIKAICAHLFDGTQTEKLKPNVEHKFDLLKHSLILSKKKKTTEKRKIATSPKHSLEDLRNFGCFGNLKPNNPIMDGVDTDELYEFIKTHKETHLMSLYKAVETFRIQKGMSV